MSGESEEKTVLVVEDDPAIRETLRVWLGRSGFRVLFAVDGPEGLEAFRTERPDLIVLDIMLPGLDGLEVCRRIRESSDVPIVMLSAQSDYSDKVNGLDVGADDYLAKPFHPRELVARVRARLRRRVPGLASSEGDSVSYQNIRLDLKNFVASHQSGPVPLTRTEFGILHLLASNPGASFTRERILNHLRGYDFEGEIRTVDSHVRNLRGKLKRIGYQDGLIESVWGVGYRLPRDL